jgi:pimeloyl-ACP methyl ester carboxylesterase/predicted amino acid-binding ACT domain protein
VHICRWGRPAATSDLDDHLTWSRLEVAGRNASYGVGGLSGPPVVFLHGWALGSRAYERAIRRLIGRGCRVYAPAMPSFGGTADLPAAEMNLDGYAAWVAAFMTAVGIDEPALVIGHSFGGGVGIKLASIRPDLVRYLVLLNAVGGVAPRPPWEWVAGFSRELWPIPQAFDTVEAVRGDALPNLVRNPLGMLRAARLAQQADLRAESAALRDSQVPVLVLTSEGDSVIPRQAFETLCEAVGADGRVVSGRHSWLLADPDSFDQAVAAVVEVQVAAHQGARAANQAEEIIGLLKHTAMARRRARALVRDAPPLWLMSDPANVLAGDLALCHPKLAADEVRAIARPIEGHSLMRLAIAAHDRSGLLADSAAVLASSRLSITGASAATWPAQGLALHSFVVDGGQAIDASGWDQLGARLRAMGAAGSAPVPLVRPVLPTRIVVKGGSEGGRSMVTVTAPDQVGLLASLCRAFAAAGTNIESLHARTTRGVARDTFLVTGSIDADTLRKLLDKSRSGNGSRPRGPSSDTTAPTAKSLSER